MLVFVSCQEVSVTERHLRVVIFRYVHRVGFLHHTHTQTTHRLTTSFIHNTVSTQLVITRNSSGDEIANVNFLYDDIVHALQSTIDSCINSTTDRFLQRRFTKFSEITQCNGHYAVQGHSRSPMLVAVESSYTTSY